VFCGRGMWYNQVKLMGVLAMNKHIKVIARGTIKSTAAQKACKECQTSCQSACKTSCTVGNQVCQNR